jgi:pimeloyl-ACP methyl ester carboxylesterase
MYKRIALLVSFLFFTLALPYGASAAASIPSSIFMHDLSHFSAHGYFYVGGQYIGEAGKEVMAGQMYVEVYKPKEVKKPYPLIFFHGNYQTGTNWMGTPDGRKGWLHYFIEQGYIVYIVDQPSRGRSPDHLAASLKRRIDTALNTSRLFTATAAFTDQPKDWPQTKLQTQWPDAGRMGDPAFDAFYATQFPSLSDLVETQRLVKQAGTALLDQIGPAILVTHSQAGTFGWILADARPNLVKGVVAVEPNGPPLRDAIFSTDPSRIWGIADLPLTYDPPATDSSELAIEETPAVGPDLQACMQQKAPARQLVNLKGIPIFITVGEAGYHTTFDQCTSHYLTQAGIKNTFARLGDNGIHGNGHMVMLEKNSLEIAAFIEKWLAENIK